MLGFLQLQFQRRNTRVRIVRFGEKGMKIQVIDEVTHEQVTVEVLDPSHIEIADKFKLGG